MKKNLKYYKNIENHFKILSSLNISREIISYDINTKNDSITYFIKSKSNLMIQIIFQDKIWKSEKNFKILEQGINKSQKNFNIERIIQYNILLYKNTNNEEIKKWEFSHNSFYKDFYMIYIYNIDAIKKSKDYNLILSINRILNL